MRTLDIYIGKRVIMASALALLVLAGLLTLFTLIDELDEVGKGRYALVHAVMYTLLTIPRHVFMMFPVSALLGSLLALGSLSASNELVAMRTSGVSQARIVWSVLKSSLFMCLLAILVGEWLAPTAEREAQVLRTSVMSSASAAQTGAGYWVRDGNSFVNIADVLPDGVLQRVSIYEFDDAYRLVLATRARQATYADGEWQLHDVEQSVLGEDGVTVVREAQQAWSSLLSPDLLSVIVIKPEYLSATGLFRYARYLRANGLQSQRYELAFWNKVLTPANLLVMTFLAVPFVFGPLRSVATGQRVLIGALIGVVFSLVSRGAGHVGLVYQLSPLVSALAPGALFLGVGLLLVYRLR